MKKVRLLDLLRPSKKVQIVLTLSLLVGVLAFLFPHNHGGLVASVLLGSGVMGMIIDAQTQLDNAHAYAATGVSTNAYDSTAAGNNHLAGNPLAIMVHVLVAATGTSIQFQAIQSANANLSAADVLVATDIAYLTVAKLVAGFKFAIPLPPHLKTKQYLGLQLTIVAGTITISSEIVPLNGVQTDIVYPKNFTITS